MKRSRMTLAFLPSLPPLISLRPSSYPYSRSKICRRAVVRSRAVLNESGDDGTFGNVDERDTVGIRIPGLLESDLSYAQEAKTAEEYRQRLVEAMNRVDDERKQRQRSGGYASASEYIETLSKPKVGQITDGEASMDGGDKARETKDAVSANLRTEGESKNVGGGQNTIDEGSEYANKESMYTARLMKDRTDKVEMKREGKESRNDSEKVDRKALNFKSQPLENSQISREGRKKVNAAAQDGTRAHPKRFQYVDTPKTNLEEQLTEGDLNQFWDEDMQKEILGEISAMERQMAELNAVVQKEIEVHQPTERVEATRTPGTVNVVESKNNDVKVISDSQDPVAKTKEEEELSGRSANSDQQISRKDSSQEELDTLNMKIAFLEKRLHAISAQADKEENQSANSAEDLQNANLTQTKDVLERPADQSRETSPSLSPEEGRVDWNNLFEDTPDSDMTKEEKVAAFKSMYEAIQQRKAERKTRAEAAAARIAQEVEAVQDDPRSNPDSMSKETALEHAVIELRLESNRYLEKARCDLDDHEDRIRRIIKKYLPNMSGS